MYEPFGLSLTQDLTLLTVGAMALICGSSYMNPALTLPALICATEVSNVGRKRPPNGFRETRKFPQNADLTQKDCCEVECFITTYMMLS